jgi:predicted nucleotidyltransferase
MIHDEVLEKALAELKERLTALYPVVRLILFGSAARGEMDEESDVDVLVLTNKPLDMKGQDAIVHEVFEINLSHDTNISVLITDLQNWEEGVFSVLPIRKEIEKEGIAL